MTLHRVSLDRVAPQPWRNGGGVTRELLQWPPGEEAWRVRVSVAEIERSGPFSAFAGIERWFAVLEGSGVRLDLPGGAQTLRAGQAPLRFAGEAAPHCELLAGPTRDLNLMLRGATGRMALAAPATPALAGEALAGPARWRALYATGPGQLEIGGAIEQLHAGLLLWSDAADDTPWRLLEAGAAYWMVMNE